MTYHDTTWQQARYEDGEPVFDLAATPTYTVETTVCELRGRLVAPHLVLETADLDEATALAYELTRRGDCCCVRRHDGSVLAPDGTWIDCPCPE